jgi:hypothetical protein
MVPLAVYLVTGSLAKALVIKAALGTVIGAGLVWRQNQRTAAAPGRVAEGVA